AGRWRLRGRSRRSLCYRIAVFSRTQYIEDRICRAQLASRPLGIRIQRRKVDDADLPRYGLPRHSARRISRLACRRSAPEGQVGPLASRSGSCHRRRLATALDPIDARFPRSDRAAGFRISIFRYANGDVRQRWPIRYPRSKAHPEWTPAAPDDWHRPVAAVARRRLAAEGPAPPAACRWEIAQQP